MYTVEGKKLLHCSIYFMPQEVPRGEEVQEVTDAVGNYWLCGMLQRVSRSFQFVTLNRRNFRDVIWRAMSCDFRVLKKKQKSQDLMLTQVVTSHRNLDLIFDH